MKTLSVIIFLGLVFSLNLNGQKDKNFNLSGFQKNDTMRITISNADPAYRSFDKKLESPGDILINPDLEAGHTHFNIESPTIMQFDEKYLSEPTAGIRHTVPSVFMNSISLSLPLESTMTVIHRGTNGVLIFIATMPFNATGG